MENDKQNITEWQQGSVKVAARQGKWELAFETMPVKTSLSPDSLLAVDDIEFFQCGISSAITTSTTTSAENSTLDVLEDDNKQSHNVIMYILFPIVLVVLVAGLVSGLLYAKKTNRIDGFKRRLVSLTKRKSSFSKTNFKYSNQSELISSVNSGFEG